MFFRDELKRHYNLGEYFLEVDIEDVASFDETLAEKLYKLPTEHLPLVYFSYGSFPEDGFFLKKN